MPKFKTPSCEQCCAGRFYALPRLANPTPVGLQGGSKAPHSTEYTYGQSWEARRHIHLLYHVGVTKAGSAIDKLDRSGRVDLGGGWCNSGSGAPNHPLWFALLVRAATLSTETGP